MYLYFDSYGTLKEVVNDNAIRQGSAGNVIYIYIEGIEYDEENQFFPVPSVFESASLDYYVINENLETEEDASQTVDIDDLVDSISEPKYVPYDKHRRSLKYFKDGYKYQFYKFIIPSEITSDFSGTVSLTTRLYKDPSIVEYNPTVLGLILFEVENSNLKKNEFLTQADYNFLLNRLLIKVSCYSKSEIEAMFQNYYTKIEIDTKINGVDYDLY